jgi:HEAT repeat protein
MKTWVERVRADGNASSFIAPIFLRSRKTMNSTFARILMPVVGWVVLVAMPCRAQQSDPAKLLQAASTGSGSARYAAIDDLGETHRDASQVVPQLRKLLADSDAQIRWRSARALGDYGDLARSAAPELRSLLTNSDPIVQYHAAAALGKIGDRSDGTTRALVTAATSKDARVARTAIAALRNLKPGPQHVMAALGEVLKSDDDAVVLHALEAIVEHGAEAVPLLNEALKRPETTYLACTAIEQIGPDAAGTVPALTELLGTTRHSHLLIQTLLALASIGPAAESAAPKIVPLLEMPNDKTVPVAAAYALGSIGAKNADAALQRAMTKDNAFLQMIAAWSIAKLHPDDEPAQKAAIEKLTQGLKNSDAGIRTAAAKSLQMLKAPPAMVAPALIALVNDPDPETQENAISAVASLGESVVPRAVNALANPQLRGPAARVLARIGPKAAGAVQPLIAAAKDGDPQFRAEINFALAAIGAASAPASQMLAESVASDDPHIRESALYALREIGPGAKAASPALVKRMQTDDSFDAMAAAWALSTIAPDDSAIAPKVVAKLTSGLSSEDAQTRHESIAALAAWGPAAKSATEALTRILKDDGDAEVRAAATQTLARISQGR